VRAVWRHPHEKVPDEVAEFLELAALPSAPFWARSQTRRVLRRWLLPIDTIETAELLASELVANAAKFSDPTWFRPRYSDLMQVARISYSLRYSPGRLIIEVGDSDPNPPVLTDADLDAENGRGLMLVQAMSKEWSYYLTPHGKIVYCVIEAQSG
jgi:anti-sigma regulatory factor (Ser/Thr protein kinase)